MQLIEPTLKRMAEPARAPRAPAAAAAPAVWARRVAFFAAVGLTAAGGATLMVDILRPNGVTTLEALILALFTVSFGWIAVSFWTAVCGFAVRALGLDPVSLRRVRQLGGGAPIRSRTALVMPIYNEDVGTVIGGLEATWRSLAATGEGKHFDIFVLSDTNRPEIARAEERGVAALRRRLGLQARIYYRRRERNIGRKAGNLADFCRRWGRCYELMVVLDADSVMAGETIVSLVRAMEATPKAGIIQTVPQPAGQLSPFARFTQFAARLYSPMLAAGLSFWQLGEANYWGHNAIIRIAPFMAHCGLPALPGDPPLGGEILSHDFVEAALMRRAGWTVHLMAELGGSWEGLPGNILDFAKRDRRWAQGNLQHLGVIGAHGLHALSRLHFVLGALAYVSSLLWLLLLLLSTGDAVLRAVVPHEFFSAGYQLFPNWPVRKDGAIVSLLAVTVGMLGLPKVLGLTLALADGARRRAFGGAAWLGLGAAAELVFSVLIAPLMMALHAWFVVSILAGSNTAWGPQNRGDAGLTLGQAVRHAMVPTVLGAAWGALVYVLAPGFFWWLTPVLAGLCLAIPLVWWSSRARAGLALARLGVFVTPEELRLPEPLRLARDAAAAAPIVLNTADAARAEAVFLPEEMPGEMPPQPFHGRDRSRAASAFGRAHKPA